MNAVVDQSPTAPRAEGVLAAHLVVHFVNISSAIEHHPQLLCLILGHCVLIDLSLHLLCSCGGFTSVLKHGQGSDGLVCIDLHLFPGHARWMPCAG